MSNQLLSEAAAFFKNDPAFHRAFDAMVQKYKSLGRVGGSVHLTNLSAEERNGLATFLRKDLDGLHTVRFSLLTFQKCLDLTRFSGIGLKELLEAVTGKVIVSNAEHKAQMEREKDGFFSSFVAESKDSGSSYMNIWVKEIRKKALGTRAVHMSYEQDPQATKGRLDEIHRALRELEQRNVNEYERLPIFAERITKNPHAFDATMESGRWLIQALFVIRNKVHPAKEIEVEETIGHTEWLNELYYYFGLLRDDLLNFVTFISLRAEVKSGRLSPYVEAALTEGAVLNMPLRELSRMNNWYVPLEKNGDSGCDFDVWVVENSGVFSAILDVLTRPMICTHGQFKLAALILMEKLVTSGATLHYSGDFDPEGLRMADFLLRRFPGRVKLWRYTVKDYRSALSHVQATKMQMSKLQGVTHPDLQPLLRELETTHRVAYQEALVPSLIADMRE